MPERFEGGLWCREVLEQLDLYVGGALAPEPLAALQTHVQACENCARFGGAYAAVVTALKTVDPEPLGEDRMARLRARLEES